MTLQFLSNVKAESLKIRRTHAFWLTLGGAGFIPLVNVIKLIGRPDVFVPRMKDNTWMSYVNDNWAPAASFLLPLYLILVISLVVQVEYSNNTWKQIYASPRTYADIFLTKFLIVNFIIAACFILFSVLIVISGYITGLLNNKYLFLSRPVPWAHLGIVAAKMYLSILGIVGVQYWLSLRIKNFITPLGVGMAMLVGGFMIQQWEYIAYYPYMQPILVYFEKPGVGSELARQATINSMLVCALALAGGFYTMCARRQKA